MSTATTAPAPTAAPGRPTRSRSARGGVLVMLDQAVVSGTNFLTVILVERGCGDEQLGYYSLGFTLLVLVAVLQESLITAPYTVFRERVLGRERAEYAGRVLVQQLGLAVLVAAAVAAAVLPGGWLGPAGWALVAVVPAALLREFARRVAFAELRLAGALAIDVAVAGLQLGLLGWLAVEHRLTAVTALGVLGVVCGVVGLVSLLLTRRNFALRCGRLGEEVGRHWAFGRWVAAGQMLGVVNGYAAHWILAGLIGPAATGVFVACLAVVTLSNPFFLGVSNLLGPRAVRARADGGPAELWRVVATTAVVVVGVMAGFTLAMAVAGEWVMHHLYRGAYGGETVTLVVLALAVTVSGPGMAADHGLRALERPRVAFVGSLAGFAVTVTTVAVMALTMGVPGAAFGYLAGTAASTAVRVAAFLRLSRVVEGRSES